MCTLNSSSPAKTFIVTESVQEIVLLTLLKCKSFFSACKIWPIPHIPLSVGFWPRYTVIPLLQGQLDNATPLGYADLQGIWDPWKEGEKTENGSIVFHICNYLSKNDNNNDIRTGTICVAGCPCVWMCASFWWFQKIACVHGSPPPPTNPLVYMKHLFVAAHPFVSGVSTNRSCVDHIGGWTSVFNQGCEGRS